MDHRAAPRWQLLLFTGLLAAAQSSARAEQLKYGEPYRLCNGERMVVYYCRGDSDTGTYVTHPLDNNCSVEYIDRPRVNGFLPQAAELRGDILKKISACAEKPAAAQAAPAAAAPAKSSSAAGNKVDVPGTGGKPVALVRFAEAKDKSNVAYVDELSPKPTTQAGVTSIWVLSVFPQGMPRAPSVFANWTDHRINCRTGEYELALMIFLDREAKSLWTDIPDLKDQIRKGSPGEALAGVACKTRAALAGPRFTSTKAAINDAMKPAAATSAQPAPAAAAAPAPTNPKDAAARADALIETWTAAYNRGDYDGALAALREYAKLYPNDPTGYLFAGYTYNAKGDQASAERSFLKAQQVAPSDPQVNLEVGSLYLKVHEDKARARTELLKVLAQKDAKADTLIPAGELLWRMDDEQSAREAFRRGVQLPGQPAMLARGWVGFGRSQWKEGKFPQAIVALNEAMRLDPKNVDAHYALSGVYEDQNNLAGVLAERQAIARLEPADAWAHYSLGDAYAAMKQMAPAVAAYDKVLEMAQRDSSAQDLLSLLSDSYKEAGRPDRAITALRTALALPNDGTLEGIESKLMSDFFHCGELSWLLVGQKQYPEVVRTHFTRSPCKDMIPDGPLGIAYVALNQPQKAIPLLEKALEGSEKSIGEAEDKASNPKLTKDEREKETQWLADLKSESSQELHALGRAYLLTGRKADAQRMAATLQRYDAALASKLNAEIASAP